MKTRTALLGAVAASALLFSAPVSLLAKEKVAAATSSNKLIPYDMITLSNGLRVIVHTERKAPVVSVAVWYHVGSKDEKPGRTGFAHLFEHLMFNGSENYNDEWFGPMEEIGATDLNGTTWFDRTNYFQTVPKTAVERVLWMESDRMGHLLGAVTQARLDEQRGVVQNEKRQGDNQPYGLLEYRVLEGLFPQGHPYRWSTIGSMEDLNAAKLDDVKDWFKTYYGTTNAILVLAGDIDMATAKPMAEKYFGHIAPGNPVGRRAAWVPKRAENTRDVLYDRVPQARISRNWAVPGYETRDSVLLALASDIVGSGKTSRLYKALVFDKALATGASLSVQDQEIVGIAEMQIDLRPGGDVAEAERVADQVLADFLAKGVTKDELERSKTSIRAGFLRGLERMGGFSGRTTILAEGTLYAGNPGHYEQVLNWLDAATPADILASARQWFGNGWHQVDILPFGTPAETASLVDRKTGLPAVTTTPDLVFPKLQETQLSNGIKVLLAERPGTPLVEAAIQFDAGSSADPGEKPGLAGLTMNMLDEGAAGKSAIQIAETLDGLGASIGVSNQLDVSRVRLSALKEKLTPSLALWADVVRRPDFNSADVERLRRNQLAGIQQEKASPQSLALRLLPPALYGSSHPYGKPFTGSGTEASIKSLSIADLRSFQESWLRPENATIYVAGGVSLAELKPLLEQQFGSWKATAAAKGTKAALTATPAKAARVAIIDKPGAPQSFILAGRVGSPGSAADYIEQSLANDVLGGAFTARVNMNLREAKSWSYGAFTFSADARGPRPWMIFAPVQSDKTKESVQELLKEVRDFSGTKPPGAQELDRQIKSNVRSLPGAFESVSSVLGRIVSDAALGRPADYVTGLKQKYENVTPASAKTAGSAEFRTDDLLWVIVGDRSKIEAGIRSLNLGPVEIWNEDGQKIG
jgi:zinc protease